ncbi:SigE family RNA polymerase sigma factor [Catellatospora sichuanensis]|uniref:SigE family RNA polymerase sigma factor n=1 Tax=Catellatospora sichuanensis TaxID=1969805 RepID=UPI001181F67C
MHTDFEEYVQARSGHLVRFAHVLCGDLHLAEDLVQDVLAKAYPRWRRIADGDPDLYLRRGLIWANSTWWRRRSSREAAVEQPPDTACGADFAQRHAERSELWHLLATLPRGPRTVLALRFFEDLDDRQIAELMGCSPATVRVHAHRGLAQLRLRLAVPVPGAAQTPPSVPVAAVRRRAAQRRHRGIAAGAAALVLIVLALLVPLLLPHTPPPVVTPSPSPSVLPLAPFTAAPAAFPYVPTVLPGPLAGMPSTPAVTDSALVLTFADPTRLWNSLELRATDARPHMPQATETITIGGTSAFLMRGTAWDQGLQLDLWWQRDGRWLQLTSNSLLTVAQAQAFAEGLRPGAQPVTSRLRLGLAPAGYQLWSMNPDWICVRAGTAPATDPASAFDTLCAGLQQAEHIVGAPEFTVGWLSAQRTGTDERPALRVFLDDTRMVIIEHDMRLVPLRFEDLIRIAETITLDGNLLTG